MLIGLSGLPRVGKDTIAEYLEERYGFETTAFALPLKAATQALFNLPPSVAYNDAVKDVPLKGLGVSPRSLWCGVADALKNHFGDDFFVTLTETTVEGWLSEKCDVVVSDVRYEKEAAMIRSLGGVVIHVTRTEAPKLMGLIADHSSNLGIRQLPGDMFIRNEGNIDDLLDCVDDLMMELMDQAR